MKKSPDLFSVFLLTLSLLFITISTSYAGTPGTVIDTESSSPSIGPCFSIYEDKDNTLTFQQIADGDYFDGTLRRGADTISMGYSDSTWWLHGVIKNIQATNQKVYLVLKEAPIESVTLYYNGKKYIKGHLAPQGDTEVDTIGTVFQLSLPPDSTLPVYIRVKSRTLLNLSFLFFDDFSYYTYISKAHLFVLICMGLIVFTILYNFFLFLILRQPSYLFYLLLAGFIFLNRVIVFGYFDFLLGTAGSDLTYYLLLVSSNMNDLFLNLFIMKFLMTEKYNRVLFRIHLVLASIIVLNLVMLGFDSKFSDKFALWMLVVSTVMAFVSGLWQFKNGYKPARYLIAAGIIPVMFTVLFGLGALNIISYGQLSEEVLLLGFVILSILLAIALADRISVLQEEKLSAQEAAIESHRILTLELERKVEERTTELNEEKEKLEANNFIIAKEIDLARKVQEQIIPINSPHSFINTLYKPMMEVGGDFFDFIEFRDNNRVGILLCDVTGHGVSAAFFTTMIKSIIPQAGGIKDDPASFLHYLNKVLYSNMGGYFCTAIYCIYDISKRTLRYSIAGHECPLVITTEKVDAIEGVKSVPLGIFDNETISSKGKDYTNSLCTLPSGCKLLLFTDGLKEIRPVGCNTFFIDNGLCERMREIAEQPGSAFCNTLYNELVAYRKSDLFEDDICYICIDVD